MASSYGMSVRRQVKQPQTPPGITLLAVVGILLGLGVAIITLVNVFLLIQQDITSTYAIAFNLTGGLVLALIIVWVNWGLLDLMTWAWWLYVLLSVAGMLVAIATIAFTPVVTPFLSELVPQSLHALLMTKTMLISESIVFLALNACVSIYLISEYQAFMVRTRPRR